MLLTMGKTPVPELSDSTTFGLTAEIPAFEKEQRCFRAESMGGSIS